MNQVPTVNPDSHHLRMIVMVRSGEPYLIQADDSSPVAYRVTHISQQEITINY